MRKFLVFFLILMVIVFLTPNLFLIGSISTKESITFSGDSDNKDVNISDDKGTQLKLSEQPDFEQESEFFAKKKNNPNISIRIVITWRRKRDLNPREACTSC